MWEQTLHYYTTLTLWECTNSILRLPQQFECKWGTPLYYKAEKITDTRLLVTFTGGQFRKIKRTQYFVDFSPGDNQTSIVVSFYAEMFGLPPMTVDSDIDLFMKQKINAERTQ